MMKTEGLLDIGRDDPNSRYMDGSGLEFEIVALGDLQSGRFPPWYKGQDLFNILVTFTEIQLILENESFAVMDSSMVFIGPAKNFVVSCPSLLSGYLIRFTARFYERSRIDTVLINSELFFDCGRILTVVRSPRKPEVLRQQVIEHTRVYMSRKDPMASLLVHNFIESLILDGVWNKEVDRRYYLEQGFTAQGIVNRFSVLVHKHYKRHHEVRYYAAKLNITPRKLSGLCMAVWNKTAKNVITDIVLKEALRYISNTDMSISQISYEMGFSDESNFRHFVKKHLGISPVQYRKGGF
ncbi:helix-turn-helix domain-containing protein [Sphingobacterium sp. Ag1]|uniref:helix-turn-helix domain-containing protein n=1 Tax=Sphingobacterium sp. Ag1 TaxID=1643451 RepID=UPI00069BC619|nr:helix-turn-helix domain-containing protein [Sphingobacterium sp. Ag1]